MRSTRLIDRIVIIGGGISGLSSAFYLQRMAEQEGREIQVTIVDAAASLGGKINTLRKEGFVIEKGPDSFLARKLPIIELTRELGLENELAALNPAAKKTYILHGGKLHPMPPGLVLGIPTELAPFAKTGLLSMKGKLRALMDFVLPSRKGDEDESVGSFMERRLGKEVTARIIEPLLAGIHAGRLDQLSLQALFPQFRESERRYGSLIRGMRAGRTAAAAQQPRLPAMARNSAFLTYRNGLSTLVDALDRALVNTTRKLGTKVAAIHRSHSQNGLPEYELQLDSGEKLLCDALIVTTPVYQTAKLLAPHMDVSELEAIEHVSVANVAVGYDKQAFGRSFDGSGFVIPRTEGHCITACTWTSTKWQHTSPIDKVLLRCYVGRSGDEAAVDLPDEQLRAAVLQDLKAILGIDATPEFVEITRLHRSMPQYPVGHVANVARLRLRAAEQLPAVWMTGAAFEGVGLPDCIHQGKQAAKQTLKQLSVQKSGREAGNDGSNSESFLL